MTEVNDSYRAACLLSGMFYTDTGIEIAASVIETFINRRWDRVAPLAHRIHGGQDRDMTKAPSNMTRVLEPEKTLAEKLEAAAMRYGRAMRNRVYDELANKPTSTEYVDAETDLLKLIREIE